MKKSIYLLLALFSFLSFSLQAQHISLGLTLGYGGSWLSDTHQDVLYKPSGNIGLTYVYSTDRHWGFAADVKYSREGVKFGYDNSSTTTRVCSDYIRVPLRAVYFLNEYGKAVRPKISLGPSFGFLTGGKIITENGSGDEISKTNITDRFKMFDLGIQGGVGVNVRLAENTWLNTDLIYYNGILAQNKNGEESMRNRNITFNVGITFGIGN